MAQNLAPQPLLELLDLFDGTIEEIEDGVTFDGDQLRSAKAELARWLRARRVRTADRVVLAIQNGIRFPAALGALLEIGSSPVLAHAETPIAELMRLAKHYHAKWILEDNWSATDVTGGGLEAAGGRAGGLWANCFLADARPDTTPAVPGSAELAGVPLHQSSGTSGEPKLALRPAAAAVAEGLSYVRRIGLGPDAVMLSPAPMSHGYGYGVLVATLISGARLAVTRRFNPKSIQSRLHRSDVDVLFAVPAMLEILTLGHGLDGLSAKTKVFSSGAMLSRNLTSRFEDKLGVPIGNVYGTTETGVIAMRVTSACGAHDDTVGPPVADVRARTAEVRPAGSDNGESLPERRLLVSSPSMMAGYVTPAGVDRSSIETEWFDTQDLAEIDARGFIRLMGRSSDMINVFGLKVMPAEVEDVIRTHPRVREVAVCAGRHRTGSSLVRAVVVGEPGLTAHDILEHCKTRLAPYKRPVSVVFADCLPKTASGKVIRAQLPAE